MAVYTSEVQERRKLALKAIVEKLEKTLIATSPCQNPTNQDRAEWARNAVQAFAVTVGAQDEGLEEQLQDLIADLMHLCDHEGLNWGRILVNADNYHRDEELEES